MTFHKSTRALIINGLSIVQVDMLKTWGGTNITASEERLIEDTADKIMEALDQLHQADLNQARIEERQIVESEMRKEYEAIRESDALEPNGLDGYWCAIRDLSLNNSDRLAELKKGTNQ